MTQKTSTNKNKAFGALKQKHKIVYYFFKKYVKINLNYLEIS